MNGTFENWLEELQRKIEYSEKKKFSKIVIQEYKNPDNFGILHDSEAIGMIKGLCGDTMEISLKIENQKII